MGERNADAGGFGDGRETDAARGRQQQQGERHNTTVGAEDARREAAEREQREHPDLVAGRGRDPERDVDLDAPIDADDDSERFRARENEDESEG